MHLLKKYAIVLLNCFKGNRGMKKVLVSLFFVLIGVNANAAVDNALVTKAEKYLNSITGLTGEFVQTANGHTERGDFTMLRPGRVRLDYKNMPIQLISDGDDLYFFDKSLDQITTVPLTSTPAGILVRKNIDLKNADISKLSSLADYYLAIGHLFNILETGLSREENRLIGSHLLLICRILQNEYALDYMNMLEPSDSEEE